MKFLMSLISSFLWVFSVFVESNGWVVVEFPQVKQLYTTERAKYNGPDPFFRKGPKELKRYCDELRVSGIYNMWTSKGAAPYMVTMPHTPVSTRMNNEPNYRYQRAVNVNERYPIPMFSCATHTNDGYWYLSYGFNDDYLFIFANAEENNGRGSALEIKGLLERSPRVDRNLQRGSGLETAFWNAMTANKSPLPDAKGKSSHLFRLCSLVVDSIRSTYSLQKVYTINFGLEYADQTPVPVSRPVMFQFLKKKDLQVEAIPCAINRGFERPNFFIVPDPDDLDSVFVLLENEDLMDSQTKFVVKHYVRDVSALRNWSQF